MLTAIALLLSSVFALVFPHKPHDVTPGFSLCARTSGAGLQNLYRICVGQRGSAFSHVAALSFERSNSTPERVPSENGPGGAHSSANSTTSERSPHALRRLHARGASARAGSFRFVRTGDFRNGWMRTPLLLRDAMRSGVDGRDGAARGRRGNRARSGAGRVRSEGRKLSDDGESFRAARGSRSARNSADARGQLPRRDARGGAALASLALAGVTPAVRRRERVKRRVRSPEDRARERRERRKKARDSRRAAVFANPTYPVKHRRSWPICPVCGTKCVKPGVAAKVVS